MKLKVAVRKRIGKLIRLHRGHKDMTREKLAEASALSANFIGEVERGEKCPSIYTFLQIAVGLGLEPDIIVNEIKNESYPTIEAYVKANRPD